MKYVLARYGIRQENQLHKYIGSNDCYMANKIKSTQENCAAIGLKMVICGQEIYWTSNERKVKLRTINENQVLQIYSNIFANLTHNFK